MHEASNLEVETLAREVDRDSTPYGFKLWQIRALSFAGVVLIGLIGFMIGFSVHKNSTPAAPTPSLPSSPGTLKSTKRRILVLRHCLRSTPKHVHSAALDADFFQEGKDLTARQLPDWGVPLYWCTHGGHEIMKHTGNWLASELGIDPAMTTITSDIVMRDAQTGLAIAEGLLNGSAGSKNKFRSFNFDATVTREDDEVACEAPTEDEARQEIEALIAKTPLPAGVGLPDSAGFEERLEAVLQKLTLIVGKGNKSFVKAMKPFVGIAHGRARAQGTFAIPFFFAQQMMYSWASGTPWIPELSKDDIMYWSAWEGYLRIVDGPPSYALTRVTKTMQSILRMLDSPEEDGFLPGRTHVFAAHDTTLDGLRLGLKTSWHAPPFYFGPDGNMLEEGGPTPPGSGLMFTMDKGSAEVSVDFIYPDFDGTLTPEIKIAHVRTFENLDELEDTAESAWEGSVAAKKCWMKTGKVFSA